MKVKKFKTISLSEWAYDEAKRLAEKQNRSISNYLETLIMKEVEK